MTKALIAISAGLLTACSQASAPEPATPPAHHDRLVTTSSERPQPSETATVLPPPPQSADAEDARVIAELERALELYQAFITRAGDDVVYADAVARSRERMADIRDTLIFVREGMKDRGQ